MLVAACLPAVWRWAPSSAPWEKFGLLVRAVTMTTVTVTSIVTEGSGSL
jgi:hypothetical protein